MCTKHWCDKTLLMFFPNVYIHTQPIKKSRKLFKSKWVKVIVALYVTLMVTNFLYRPFFWLKSVHVSFQMHYLLLTEIIFEHSKLCGLHFVELFIFQLLFTRLA